VAVGGFVDLSQRLSVLSTPHTEGAHINNDKKLPWPYPPRRHPPLMEFSFAALGWINRAARAVGSDRFVETVHRARFNIDGAAAYAVTPAEMAVLEGLSATLDAVVQADAEARALLGEAVSELAEAFAADVDQFLQTTDDPSDTGELRVTWGSSDRKAGGTSVHKSIERPGPVWVVVVKRERIDQWRAMWYFGTRELAEDGAQRALGRVGQGGEVLETDVVEGRAYLKGRDTNSEMTQLDPESKGMRSEK
jgi:hypothetical protein